MSNIAIIPARAGSKRIAQKNIKSFLGIPMLTRTIAVLEQCQIFDEIVVSTDSEDFANVAKICGATVPDLRPINLSADSTPTVDVIAHMTKMLNLSLNDNVCCVYAPNPFLLKSAICLALTVLDEKPIPSYVTTVTTFPFPIQRSLRIDGTSLLQMVSPENILVHSQDLEPRYHETAQFWWAKAITWLEKKPMQSDLKGILIPRWITQDIDTEEDWMQAEIRFRILQEMGNLEEMVSLDRSNVLNEWSRAE